MRSRRIPLCFLLISIMLSAPILGQSGKPVIIRDTDIAEGIDEDEADRPKEPDAGKAKENFDVGNFYHKRKNYVAAIQRYLTAIEYQPDSAKAVQSLVRAYESIVKKYESIRPTPEALAQAENQHGRISVAIDAFEDFLRIYPDSERKADFRRMIAGLEEVSSRFDSL